MTSWSMQFFFFFFCHQKYRTVKLDKVMEGRYDNNFARAKTDFRVPRAPAKTDFRVPRTPPPLAT